MFSKTNLFKSVALVALGSAVLFSCKEEEKKPSPTPTPDGTTYATYTVNNLVADTAKKNRPTFYSLADNKVIDVADSNSTKWDIAFMGTKILFNSLSSGPGTTVAQIVDGVYADYILAPENGYRADTSTSKLAITASSGKGWYNYNTSTHIITPIAGKVIVVKTNAGYYAKLEILNYYKDSPANPTGTDKARFYTFRYGIQKDKTRNLK